MARNLVLKEAPPPSTPEQDWLNQQRDFDDVAARRDEDALSTFVLLIAGVPLSCLGLCVLSAVVETSPQWPQINAFLTKLLSK